MTLVSCPDHWAAGPAVKPFGKRLLLQENSLGCNTGHRGGALVKGSPACPREVCLLQRASDSRGSLPFGNFSCGPTLEAGLVPRFKESQAVSSLQGCLSGLGRAHRARGHSPALLPAPPSSWMLMMPSRAWMRRKAGMNMTRWPCLCERRPRPPPSPPFHCSTSSGKAEVQGHLTDPQVPPGAAAKARGLGGGRKGCLESLPQWPD